MISGAIYASYSIPTNLIAGTYYYYCVVSAAGAMAQSSAVAEVTVLNTSATGITINAHPRSTTVTARNISSNLSISASINPSGTLNYQWYSNTTDSNIGGDLISGATNSIFSIPTNLNVGTYYYYCVVSVAGAYSVPSKVSIVTVEGSNSGGGGGGCNTAGYGCFATIFLGLIPFRRRKDKR
jgi:hypothetical protein